MPVLFMAIYLTLVSSSAAGIPPAIEMPMLYDLTQSPWDEVNALFAKAARMAEVSRRQIHAYFQRLFDRIDVRALRRLEFEEQYLPRWCPLPEARMSWAYHVCHASQVPVYDTQGFITNLQPCAFV